MSAVKNYFKQETQLSMLALEHPRPSDFYLSVWQTNRSAVPLLIWRALLFLASIGIMLSSMIIYILNGKFSFWFIYLTHWGLMSITFATGLATAVSLRCYFYGPLSADFCLPWYVKTYWVVYNIAVPLAFLITIFYWALLFEAGIEEELNHGLDVAVHGLNSIIMFFLMATCSHPSRILHIYQPIIFAMCYVIFGVIYYFAGGTDQKGNRYIYPVVNWAEPGSTIVVVLITGLLLLALHFITVGIALGRNTLSIRYVKPPNPTTEDGLPLRRTPQVL